MNGVLFELVVSLGGICELLHGSKCTYKSHIEDYVLGTRIHSGYLIEVMQI